MTKADIESVMAGDVQELQVVLVGAQRLGATTVNNPVIVIGNSGDGHAYVCYAYGDSPYKIWIWDFDEEEAHPSGVEQNATYNKDLVEFIKTTYSIDSNIHPGDAQLSPASAVKPDNEIEL